MASAITQSRGLDGIPASVKVTLKQVILRMMDSYEITEKEIDLESKCEKLRAELKEQRLKLLAKFEKKEISANIFHTQDLQYNLAINEYELKLQQIQRNKDAKNFRRERLELIQTILDLDINQTLSIMEKYDVKDKLYAELSERLKNEALASLNHDINIIRLKKYSIMAVKASERTAAQNNQLDEYTNALCELQNEADVIKKLIQTKATGDIKQIHFEALVSEEASKLTHKVFAEELYINADQKRAV